MRKGSPEWAAFSRFLFNVCFGLTKVLILKYQI